MDYEDVAGLSIEAGLLGTLKELLAARAPFCLVGPPGCGKTMLAQRLCHLMPPLTDEERVEVCANFAWIAQRPWEPTEINQRPFRAPHHTVSEAGVLGNAVRRGPYKEFVCGKVWEYPASITLQPGELTLAHRGVLFLDEVAEFRRPIVESTLRCAGEQATTVCARDFRVSLPASVQLVAATNPCPCGYAGTSRNVCRCPEATIERYLARIPEGFVRIRLELQPPARTPRIAQV